MIKKPGSQPGTLVHIGEKKVKKSKIEIIDYNSTKLTEKKVKKPEECFPFKKRKTVTWINVTGIHDTELISKLGKNFGIHHLALEDILNTNQRPKIEIFDDYAFIVLKMLSHSGTGTKIKIEQVSIILGANFLISFQERDGDVFNPIRERIKGAKGRVRKEGADYLAYVLIDAIIDNYFTILETISDKLEVIEKNVLIDPTTKTINDIHQLKRELIFLRKSIWPLRELISTMQKGELKLIKKSTIIYLRDLYDHTIQVADTVETLRDMTSGLLDVYLSSTSNKLNEIMKVLTIFAAIFIPLTFIAGIYGMNFRFMPELGWKNGYYMALGFMGVVGISMLYYFKRKGWM